MMNIELEELLDKHVLCAVSGGADSMCLLQLLLEKGIRISAAHYEHGIRGEESERDLEFVQDYCRIHSIPFVFARGNVPDYAEKNAMSIEEAARKLRYEFLEQTRLELGCDLIATAHNLNDNAETLLFNLARGSGSAGMAGIPPKRGDIIRPLIHCSRRDIEQYLLEHHVPHVEDSTNRCEDYTRNLIRRRIVPLMQGINPRFIHAAARTAELCRRDDECLEAMARDFTARQLCDDTIPLAPFNALHAAIASRVLRSLLPGLHMDHVEMILAFCREDGYGELSVPGRRLMRDQGLLYLTVPQIAPLPLRRVELGKPLPLPECGLIFHSEICDYMGEVNDLFKTSYIKYEIMCSDLYIGGRQNGDRMRPIGRGCSKTLKALFMESRYPRHLRDSCPVLRDGEGPLLVFGLAADERTKPRMGEKAVKISFSKINSFTGE